MLRANFLSHDPDSQASVTAHEKLLTALRDLGLELQPAAPPMDLVSLCKQHGLELSRLLAELSHPRVPSALGLHCPHEAAGSPRARMLVAWRAATGR